MKIIGPTVKGVSFWYLLFLSGCLLFLVGYKILFFWYCLPKTVGLEGLPNPRGYFQIRSGGLDLTSSLEAKFGVRSGQVHQLNGKTWEILPPQDAKVGKSPNFGVIFEIQRAKFGVFVTYIFGGKILGFNKNFRGKFWGQAPPRPPDMEVPPWVPDLLLLQLEGFADFERILVLMCFLCDNLA